MEPSHLDPTIKPKNCSEPLLNTSKNGNMNAKHYGSDDYWCFIEEGWDGKEIAIWKGPPNNEEIIARATDKYEAQLIVDALIANINETNGGKLGKKELAFLDFVKAYCAEPYATMAANAILWNDRDAYSKLKFDFPMIY